MEKQNSSAWLFFGADRFTTLITPQLAESNKGHGAVGEQFTQVSLDTDGRIGVNGVH